MWRWVFLDVGNILLDEDPLTYLSFRRHAEAVERVRPDVRFRDLLALREARVAAGSVWPVYDAASTFLSEEECAAVWEDTAREIRHRFDQLSPPVAGAADLIDHLAQRYRLGLIANQGSECRVRLAALGLLDRFEVVALSDEQSCSKPDPQLFLQALRTAQAGPAECLMVGDRLDNDVAPAAALGLATAWVRWPVRIAKGWGSGDPDALAYLASLERSSLAVCSRYPALQPTLVCDEVGHLANWI